ncbi:hypothetical protein T01_930 [Trichinella spiralis]|uniref:GW182 middle domain-containing protein n=2 Tax=Trichinella spiralis TaxID=6334 RepID=A0A0V1BZU7_TRISP|nr:hypothetical protein T01_930 [Trichinella spiralis]
MEKGQVAQSADCARICCVCVHMERRTTMMVPPAIGSALLYTADQLFGLGFFHSYSFDLCPVACFESFLSHEYRSNVRFLFACSSIMWNIDGGNNSGTGNPLFTENLDPNTSSSSSSSSSSSVWSNVNSSNPNNNSNNLLISGSSSSSVKNSSKNAWDPSSSTSASNWKNSGPTGSVGGSSDWCGVVKASADVNNSAWSQSRTTQGENSQSVCSSSWSEIARKSINTAPPAQSNPIGSVINPAKDCNYEMGTGNWGKPVDQGTPWDVGNAGSSNNSNGGGNDPANAGGRRTDDESLVASSSWGSRPAAREPAWNTSNNSSGGNNNNNSSSSNNNNNNNNNSSNNTNNSMFWKPPTDKEQQWAAPPLPPPPPPRTSGGWEDVPSTSTSRNNAWNSQEGAPNNNGNNNNNNNNNGNSSNNNNNNANNNGNNNNNNNSNIWNGPPLAQDSSMIWNNPYPKKNTMPDKGTAIWGDPAAQGEIKRWKNSNEDANSVSTPPNPAPSTSAGAPSTSSKVAILPNAGSVWKDSPIAPQPVKPLNGWGTTGMNSPYGGLNATGALDASSSWMNDAAAAGGQVWNNDAASAKPGTSRQDVGNRRNVDSNLVGDDIFASHMIPGPSTNCDNSMALAHQVAEKLNIAMRTGHIDSTILNQPLPQETLLKLRQLLQCITKLEQSKIELQHLQTLEHNGTLNASQQQEYRRLAGEVNQLRLTARNLRSQFSAAQQTSLRKNTSSNDVTFGCSMPTSDLPNQSKLMQWKHGPLNPLNMYLSTDRKPIYINGGDCAAAISATASTSKQFGVFDMTAGSSSDPWSNTKRQSGFEWPIDSFMKTGDMKDLRSSIFPSAAAAYGTLEDAVAAVVSQSDKNGIIGRHMSLDMSLASSMPGTSGAHTFGTGIIGIDDGPPEFRPGQKWEWRDPKEVADDPNATPGSVKTSSIGLGRFGHDLKPTYQAGPSTSGFAHGAYSMPSTSLLSAITTPTKSCIDPTISSISPNYATDSWSAKSFRPIMQTTTSSAAYSPFSAKSPSRVMPYAAAAAAAAAPAATPITTAPQYASSSSSIPSTSCGLQWIVLMHLTQQTMDEQTLQYLFNRVGPVQAFVFPPGSGFAAVKFKDVSAEKAFARLQQDCSVYSNGLVIYIAKDNEVERLLQSTKNCQMFGPPGSLPPPPPGIVWDMPPPPPPNTQWTPAGPPHPFAPPPPPPPPGQMPLPEQLAAMGHPPNTVYGDTYYNMDSRHPTF